MQVLQKKRTSFYNDCFCLIKAFLTRACPLPIPWPANSMFRNPTTDSNYLFNIININSYQSFPIEMGNNGFRTDKVKQHNPAKLN